MWKCTISGRLHIQCNLVLVTLLVSTKTVTKSYNVTNRMVLCSKLKNGLCKIVAKSQVVTKFNVTKSRLHCISLQLFTIAQLLALVTFVSAFFVRENLRVLRKKN